jgi:hypothetical protein
MTAKRGESFTLFLKYFAVRAEAEAAKRPASAIDAAIYRL